MRSTAPARATRRRSSTSRSEMCHGIRDRGDPSRGRRRGREAAGSRAGRDLCEVLRPQGLPGGDRQPADRRCVMESVIVEIRAAEGGEDAKLLVHEQVAIYAKYCARKGYQAEIVNQQIGGVSWNP